MKNKARLILLILSSFLIAGNGTGQRFTRTLGIPGPGWISIPVDGHMWRYAGSTLDIVDSAGTHLSRKIVFPEDRPPVTPSLLPVLHDLEIQNDRAILSLTLQGATVNHHRLIVQFDRPSYVPWAILEASPDRRNWKELARGKLFTLNLRDSLTQSALDYPPTDARYLRLILHGEDRNLPAIRQIQVLAHREADPWDAEVVPLLPVDSEMVEAMGEPSISAGRPDLPPWPLEARTLELPLEKNHPPFTVTFWNLVNGSLNRGYACVLRPGVTTVPVPGGTLHSPMLVSWDQKIGEMKEVTVKRYPKVLAVYAEHPGALSVSYGGVEKSPDRTLQIPPDSNRPVYDLSPPVEKPLALSEELTRLVAGNEKESGEADGIWKLQVPQSVSKGQWVEMELTEGIYREAKRRITGLYIEADGKIVPSLILTDPVPLLVLRKTLFLTSLIDEKDPVRGSNFDMKDVFLPLTFWVLRTEGPLNHTLRLQREMEMRKNSGTGQEEKVQWRDVTAMRLFCDPWSDSCVFRAPLPDLPDCPLRVTLSPMGDFPSPDSIELMIWRARHRIVFPLSNPNASWNLTSQKGRGDTAHPVERYLDSERFPDVLPAVMVGTLSRTEKGRNKELVSRILFIAALLAAAVGLIYTIFRLLRTKEHV